MPALPQLPSTPARRQALRAALALLAGAAVPPLHAQPTYADSPRAAQLADRLAAQTGLDAAWVRAQLARAAFQPTVARLIVPGRPEQQNWRAYRARFVEPRRIDAGAAFAQRHQAALDAARARWGVPAEVIVGILGVETLYGRDMGRFRVLDALTTLALDFPAAAPKDRSAYFTAELGEYLRWCHAGGIDPTSVRGSYAGAIGMPQFMPGSILRWGVAPADGTPVDLIGNADDAIASVGNFLAGHGWTAGQPCDFPLLVPADVDAATLAGLLAPDITPTFTAAELEAAHLPLLPRVLDYPGRLAVIRLANADAAPDYILGTDNFFALTRYNHSAFYALAVLELGRAALEQAADAG